MNSVTAGDYSRPLRISAFINELDSGFRLLNLKNDSLRKRYDGLKYDVKKIEEVVYDLSIRGLNKEATVGAGGEKWRMLVWTASSITSDGCQFRKYPEKLSYSSLEELQLKAALYFLTKGVVQVLDVL